MNALPGLILAIMTLAMLAIWIHALVTYDWSKFDEDSQAIKDDPHSHFP
jgi:cbb3-type cytochrome oxidase subunit 3